IAEQVIHLLPEKTSDEPVNEDWAFRFFQAAKDVSDEEMQSLWARILSAEIAHPGSYRLRTIEFLRTLAKDEALMYADLCRFMFGDTDETPFIFTAGEPEPSMWTQ